MGAGAGVSRGEGREGAGREGQGRAGTGRERGERPGLVWDRGGGDGAADQCK